MPVTALNVSDNPAPRSPWRPSSLRRISGSRRGRRRCSLARSTLRKPWSAGSAPSAAHDYTTFQAAPLTPTATSSRERSTTRHGWSRQYIFGHAVRSNGSSSPRMRCAMKPNLNSWVGPRRHRRTLTTSGQLACLAQSGRSGRVDRYDGCRRRLTDGGVMLIDVRGPDEFNGPPDHLPGAINIPLAELPSAMAAEQLLAAGGWRPRRRDPARRDWFVVFRRRIGGGDHRGPATGEIVAWSELGCDGAIQ